MIDSAPGGLVRAPEPAGLRGQLSWALVEFARNPYVSLVFMFVFAPYFASTVVGDAVRGQKLWSFAYTVSGACIAIGAPLLGAIVDRLGRRKPWIALTIGIMAPACGLLWFAMPAGHGGLPVPVILLLAMVLMICFESGSVAHNAMLPDIATSADIGRVSGLGLACGALGSVLSLGILLFGVVWPATPAMHWSFLPDHPWFGLDALKFEHARIVGPVAGAWMLLFVVPLLLWTPDRPATGSGVLAAIGAGTRQLFATVAHARSIANIGLFLAGRMLYNDAMVALQAYCGIYAAGVFGWDLATIMVFALLLIVACVAGGAVGGWLDVRLGSRRAILAGVAVTFGGVLLAVSLGPDQVLFMHFDARHAPPVWSLPYFRTLPELLYLVAYLVLAVSITAVLVNSRAMMARIAPLSMMSQFFGLYALSGTATAFLGHGLVALGTSLLHSQRAGLCFLLLPLAAGWLLMLRTNESRAAGIA